MIFAMCSTVGDLRAAGAVVGGDLAGQAVGRVGERLIAAAVGEGQRQRAVERVPGAVDAAARGIRGGPRRGAVGERRAAHLKSR